MRKFELKIVAGALLIGAMVSGTAGLPAAPSSGVVSADWHCC